MNFPISWTEDEDEAAKKRREGYLRHAWAPATAELTAKEPPVFRHIQPELIAPYPENQNITEMSSALDPEELAPTPMGRLLLADRLARMKKASPPGTEIGVRINPLTGEAEAYARGAELQAAAFRKKMEVISQFPIYGGSKEAPNMEAYKDPHSLLSQQEQDGLIQASQEAFKVISEMPENCTTRKEILNHLRQQPEYSCAAFSPQQKTDIETLLSQLKCDGLREIPETKVIMPKPLKTATPQIQQV